MFTYPRSIVEKIDKLFLGMPLTVFLLGVKTPCLLEDGNAGVERYRDEVLA